MTQRDPQPRIEDVTRVVLMPIASPLPLGFFAFGLGAILQSALQFGLIPQADVQNLALLFGAFVFPLEILAALLAYFARESVGATILSIIAFSWLGTAIVTYASAPDPTRACLVNRSSFRRLLGWRRWAKEDDRPMGYLGAHLGILNHLAVVAHVMGDTGRD